MPDRQPRHKGEHFWDENLAKMSWSTLAGTLQPVQESYPGLAILRLSVTKREFIVKNSLGVEGYDRGTWLRFSCGSYRRTYRTSTGFHANGLAAECVRNRSFHRLTSHPVKAINAVPDELVIEPNSIGRLLTPFVSCLRLETYQSSFLRGKLGEYIGPRFLNIVDDPSLVNGAYSLSIDHEGVPASRKIIVRRGRLISLLSNTSSAAKYGSCTTANACRSIPPYLRTTSRYVAEPIVTHWNLLFTARRAASKLVMVSETKKGLLVRDLRMFNSDLMSGDFSALINAPLLIRGGELKSVVKPLMIQGNLARLLQSIVMVGNDYERTLDESVTTPSIKVSFQEKER